MWILPKNYHLSSHFARDMVELKQDLTCQDLNIESSLTWRSKSTRLQTWLRRWKPDSYLLHLFTRILKHSQRTCFEEKLTLSLEDIPVSRSVQQDSEKAQMIHDTCGHISGDTLNQLDLLDASLKTSRVISRLDSPQLLAIWKKMVTEQRGEYSARKKLAHRTEESECISWATPNTMDHLPQRSEEALIRQATTTRKGRSKPANLREQVNPTAVQIYQHPTIWPTPTTQDNIQVAGQYKNPNSGTTLGGAVRTWPTPSAHEARLGYQDRSDPTKKGTQESLTTVIVNMAGGRGKCSGHLNPDWVEWLMGVPTGWTELGSWGTE